MKYALKQFILLSLFTGSALAVDLSSVNKFEVVTELQDQARAAVAKGFALQEPVKAELATFSNRNTHKHTLTLGARQALMDHMCTLLFDASIERPFRIPSSSLGLSQMDAYLILMADLIEDIAAHDAQYKKLSDAFHSCVRIEALYKISLYLNKPEFHAMMPEQMRAKFGASKFANMGTLGLLFSSRVRCKTSRPVEQIQIQAAAQPAVVAPAQPSYAHNQQPSPISQQNLEQIKQKSFLSYLSWTNLSSLWKRMVVARVYILLAKLRIVSA